MSLKSYVAEAFSSEKNKMKVEAARTKAEIGKVYRVSDAAAKTYHWDTETYRMLCIDNEGQFIAYRIGVNKVIQGVGHIGDNEVLIDEKPPKSLSVGFKIVPEAETFWNDIFNKATKNTKIKIKK